MPAPLNPAQFGEYSPPVGSTDLKRQSRIQGIAGGYLRVGQQNVAPYTRSMTSDDVRDVKKRFGYGNNN